ncbi:MAG: hypothetical protein ACOC85_05395 [Thermoplasmatota archaeon]
MFSKNCDLDEFIDSVKDKNKFIVQSCIDEEVEELKIKCVSDKNKEREYFKKLKSLQFFLKNEIKPPGLDFEVFKKFKPLCENLVEKGQMSGEVLQLFDE